MKILLVAACPLNATTCIPNGASSGASAAPLFIGFAAAIAVGVGIALYVRKKLVPSTRGSGNEAQKGAGLAHRSH